MTEYTFHPLSETYPLMEGEAFEDLKESIRQSGQRETIALLGVQVLDGRNRYRACKDLGIKPKVEQYTGDKDEASLLKFIEDKNEHRRHLTPEFLKLSRAEKRQAIAEALKEDPEQSNRQVAEEVGVSDKTVQPIREELERRAEIPHVESRKDTKGREQPASKPKDTSLWCSRCKTLGVQNRDCPACKTVRDDAAKKPKPARKKPTPRAELKDKVGNVLPDSCRDAFADLGLPTLIENLESIEAMFMPEPWVACAGKLTDHYGFILIDKFREHIYEALSELQLATEALRAGVPHAVCPKCNAVDSKGNGKCCKGCRGYGHVPITRYQELTKEPS